MSKPQKNPEREDRIDMEVVVDAHDEDERVMGWYYYLDDKIQFPFQAKCIEKRRSSPLGLGKTVKVLSMCAEESERDMLVEIEWEGDRLAVPLGQLKPVKADDDTEEAVADWHYWIEQGYSF
ncbi:MAG: calcium-binding protein [Alkalinema sp. RU_4_3]|nr:calcium-binding protein [Alkalinema sp. RU_4_3]